MKKELVSARMLHKSLFSAVGHYFSNNPLLKKRAGVAPLHYHDYSSESKQNANSNNSSFRVLIKLNNTVHESLV